MSKSKKISSITIFPDGNFENKKNWKEFVLSLRVGEFVALVNALMDISLSMSSKKKKPKPIARKRVKAKKLENRFHKSRGRK